MPVRVALNVVYALWTGEMDSKQKRDFDDSLYGWDAENAAATRELLRGTDESGGEG